MASPQLLLFPDPRPLVERLGATFFRQAPSGPGVYLMRDREGAVLYVGKAKNLRQRLSAYRVANPDRMARRHLRLLRQVDRIELQLCETETEALSREGALLGALRPRFNRAGIYAAPRKVLSVGVDGAGLHLSVSAQPREGWEFHFTCGVGGFHLRQRLVRLIGLRLLPGGLASFPAGWWKLRRTEVITVPNCPESVFEDVIALLRGNPGPFQAWVQGGLEVFVCPFAINLARQDLEDLSEMLSRPLSPVS